MLQLIKGIVCRVSFLACRVHNNWSILDVAIWVVGKLGGLPNLKTTPPLIKEGVWNGHFSCFGRPIFGFPFSQSSRSGHPPFIYALGRIFPLPTTERFFIYGFKLFQGTLFPKKWAK